MTLIGVLTGIANLFFSAFFTWLGAALAIGLAIKVVVNKSEKREFIETVAKALKGRE